MIVISKTFSLPQYYDFSNIASLKDILFIDIETTGLTAHNSSVYLIGAVYHQQMEWHIRQWFSDSLSSEQEILQSFFEFVKGFKVIISYNGSQFDIPFLKKCAIQYGIDDADPFSNLESFDLFRKMKPLKRLLNLPDLKLRTIESFLNIERADSSTGSELIEIYNSYLNNRSEDDYSRLLLHNEEDLKALPQIMPMLSYIDIFRSEWNLAGQSLNTTTFSFTAVIDCSVKIPASFTYVNDKYTLSIRANQMIIELEAFHGDLKYFFSDYKDYYYLPDEDRAVHKKIGQYVDPEHRVQACASNCYTHKESIYLPLVQEDMFTVFKSSYNSHDIYTEYVDDNDFILAYLHNILSGILSKS